MAKAGREEGIDLIGGSAIIAPSGEIVSECDLAAAAAYRKDMFDFERHRRPDQYGIITRTSAMRPIPEPVRALTRSRPWALFAPHLDVPPWRNW